MSKSHKINIGIWGKIQLAYLDENESTGAFWDTQQKSQNISLIFWLVTFCASQQTPMNFFSPTLYLSSNSKSSLVLFSKTPNIWNTHSSCETLNSHRHIIRISSDQTTLQRKILLLLIINLPYNWNFFANE